MAVLGELCVMSIVFDSSVVIAILKQEVGYQNAEFFLEDALISAVNYAEVVECITRLGYANEEIKVVLQKFPFKVISLNHSLAEAIGLMSRETKKYGLSLGDRACLALAIDKQLPVLTADRVWANLDVPIEVKQLR